MAIRELINDIEVFYDPTLLEDPLTQRNVPPFEHRHFENPIEFAPFPPLNGDSLIFETQYTFNIPAQNPGLYPNVERNDTVRQTTYMTNYFSYDDGVRIAPKASDERTRGPERKQSHLNALRNGRRPGCEGTER